MPTLFSKEALSRELGKDRRVVAKLLDGVRPDGRRHGRPVWRLATILPLLPREDAPRPTPREHSEIERLALEMVARIEELMAERDIEKRRTLLREKKLPVGPFIAAAEKLDATLSESERFIHRLAWHEVVRHAVGQAMQLCHMRMGDDDEHG